MLYRLLSVVLLAATFSLAACAVSKDDGVMSAQERKGGFLGLSKQASVQVNTPKAFAQKQQVVIGGFKVGFNESKRMANEAGSGFGGKSTGLVRLEGVSNEVRQAITDQIYADFVAQLQAAGYTVAPHSAFTSSSQFAKAKSFDFPYTSDNSGFLSQYGEATYFSPSAIGARQPIFPGEIQGETGGFALANPAAAAAEYGKQTGTAVLNVAYFVDFAGKDGHGGRFSSTSSLKVGQLLAVDQGLLGFTAGHGGSFSTAVGSMTLGQPIASDQPFARIEETSSGAEKGLETAGNVFSAVLGGGTNQTRKFVYHANPGQYQTAAVGVLKQANSAFVTKMAELR